MSKITFGVIYKAKNLVNGKCYIGQTTEKDIIKYCLSHIKNAFAAKNYKKYFHNAIRKYGAENFVFRILELCDSKEELDEMEFHYIKQYNSFCTENGYNMTWGGGGILGYKHTKQAKIDIGAAAKLLVGEKNHRYGVEWTDEEKLEKSNWNKIYWTEEKRNEHKIRQQIICNTPEYKKTMSDWAQKTCKTEEFKKSVSDGVLKMYKENPEVLEKISKNSKKMWTNESFKKRMSSYCKILTINNEIIEEYGIYPICKKYNLNVRSLLKTLKTGKFHRNYKLIEYIPKKTKNN